MVSTAVYGATTLFFALTSSYLVALVLLLIGGIANLALCLGTLAAGIYALRDRAPGA